MALWLLGTLPFLTRLSTGRTSRDLEHYWDTASAVLGGAGIYTDVFFEYPPYALAWFLGPAALADTLAGFRLAFGLLIWALDAAVKGALLWEGIRAPGRSRPFLPFVMYTLATAAIGHFLLQRYDVIPAALSFAALIALSRGRAGAAGVLIAVAAATKVYPALFVPIMAVFAWRHGRALAFAVGGTLGLIPLLIASWQMPWWRFMEVHAGRGLQAESLWASVLWLLHYAGVPAKWEMVTAWFEVTGPVASSLVTPARLVWAAATLGSVGIAVWTVWRGWADAGSGRDTPTGSLPALAAALLLPVTTFVALNPILSPQFHLWLIPWCALALFADERSAPPRWPPQLRRAIWCIFFATFLVPAFVPSPTYDDGLDLGRTMVLVLRNLLLLYATWCLWKAVLRVAGRRTVA